MKSILSFSLQTVSGPLTTSGNRVNSRTIALDDAFRLFRLKQINTPRLKIPIFIPIGLTGKTISIMKRATGPKEGIQLLRRPNDGRNSISRLSRRHLVSTPSFPILMTFIPFRIIAWSLTPFIRRQPRTSIETIFFWSAASRTGLAISNAFSFSNSLRIHGHHAVAHLAIELGELSVVLDSAPDDGFEAVWQCGKPVLEQPWYVCNAPDFVGCFLRRWINAEHSMHLKGMLWVPERVLFDGVPHHGREVRLR